SWLLSPSRSRPSASLAAALGAAGTGRSGLCPRSARHCPERTAALAPSVAHSGSPVASARARAARPRPRREPRCPGA
ncbi:hypothetical protein MC885_006917, partial [Smutsia gigantea]